jgi:hypothetical protein
MANREHCDKELCFDQTAINVEQSRQGYLLVYAQIAFNQLRRYANLKMTTDKHRKDYENLRDRLLTDAKPLEADDLPNGWRTFTLGFELQSEELECQILAVLSAALFLEAYIYDFCAQRESDTFARKYLDKLDPVAKWVIIPRLFMPPGLDPGDEVFGRLRKLFELRNELIHHKTKSGDGVGKLPEFPAELQPVNCLQIICDLLKKLREIDPKDTSGEFILRQISSWVKYSAMDSRFYPIIWEA